MIFSRKKDFTRKFDQSFIDISPSGVTIFHKKIESDQIVPLLKSYVTVDGVKKLTKNMNQETLLENMEKGYYYYFIY